MSVRRSYLASLGNQAAHLAAVMLIMVCVARALGPAGKGAFALVVALPTMLVAVTQLSMPAGIVYFGSRDGTRIGALAANALLLTVVVGGPVAAVVWAAGAELGTLLRLEFAPHLWWWVVGLLPPTYLAESGAALLTARRRFGRMALGNAAVGGVFVVLFAVAMFGRPGRLETACALFVAYRTVRAAVLWALVGGGGVGPRRPDGLLLRRTLGYSLQGHVGTILQMGVYRLDLLLVGGIAGTAAAGLYSAATYLAEALAHFPQALGAVVLPEVASRDTPEAAEVAARVCRQTLWTTVAGGVVLCVAAPVLVPLLFGGAFRDAVTAVWLLVPGLVALAVSRVLGPAVAGGGWPWAGSVGAAIALALTVGGDLLLIPQWSYRGAAVASSVAYLVQCAFFALMLHWQTGVSPGALVAVRWDDFRMVRQLWERVGRA